MRYLFLLGLCHALLLSCKTTSSQTKHDVGRFVNDDTRFAWAVIDETTYRDLMRRDRPILPQDESQTIKLQQWTDDILKKLVQTAPELSLAPRPIVRIVQDDHTVNANISQVCLMVQGPFIAEVGDGTLPVFQASSILAFDRIGQTLNSTVDPQICRPFDATAETKLAFVRWLFRGDPACEVTLNGETLTIHRGCSYLKSIREWSSAGKNRNLAYRSLGTMIPHNYITVRSGLVRILNEESTRAILTHELSHYLMGHGAYLPSEYDYFYEIGAQNYPHKPQPLPESHPLAVIGRRIQQQTTDNYKVIEGQSFHSLMYYAATDIALSLDWAYKAEKSGGAADFKMGSVCLAAPDTCYSNCTPLIKGITSNYDNALLYFPRGRTTDDAAISNEERQMVMQYETDLKRCFTDLKADPLFLDKIQYTLNNQVSVATDLKPHLNLSIADDATLLNLFGRASQLVTTVKNEDSDLKADDVRRALEAKLGWYTIEVEADEMATEIMIRMGYDPHSYQNALLALFSANPKYPAGAAQSCREDYERGFPNFVPPGNFKSLHNDPCFRVYNSYRELKAHESDYTQFR